MVIIGGLGSIIGSFLGAAFIVVLPIVISTVPRAFELDITSATVEHIRFMIVGASDHLLPDRRAGRSGAFVADHAGETAAVAVPVLRPGGALRLGVRLA